MDADRAASAGLRSQLGSQLRSQRTQRLTGFDAIVAAPFGAVGVCVAQGRLTSLAFLDGDPAPLPARNELSARASEQIQAYLNDPRAKFDLPLNLAGTEFQRRVWDQIAAIPSGATRTYGELARSLNATARAVGQACGENRHPLVIPCHRVVAATGVGGFAHASAGFHIEVKRWLLLHEGRLGKPRDHGQRVLELS